MDSRIIVMGVLLLLAGCKGDKKYWVSENTGGVETTTIDFTAIGQSRDSVVFQELLPLSELSDDIQVVKLETKDECLIAGYARYRISDSYILVFQSDQVMLFARDGRFLHTVARGGRGPQEISAFSDAAIDEKRDRVYISDDFGKVKIYSLHDTAYFEHFSLMEEPLSVFLSGDGRLLVTPYYSKKVENMIYEADTTGKLLDSIPCPPSLESISFYFRGHSLFSELDGKCYYMSPHRDTIYQFLDRAIRPRWVFKKADNQNINISGESPDKLFIDVNTLVKEETYGNNSSAQFFVKTYCLDKKSMKLKEFRRISDDHFALASGGMHRLYLQSGKWFYWVYPASELSESIGTTLEKDGVKPEIRDNLREFGKILSPEDNPVLVIGRLK